MKKKWLACVALLLALLLAAGCAQTDTAAEGGDTSTETGETSDSATVSGEKLQVYLIVSYLGDQSYWDSEAAGFNRALEDFSDQIEGEIIEATDDPTKAINAAYEACDSGADLVFLTQQADVLREVAEQYPDVMFVHIEEEISDVENCYSVGFNVSEAAFLGGMAAADVAKDGNNVLGYIGALDDTVILQEFLMGYIQGAKYYSPDVSIVTNYVGSFSDPETARTQATVQYNEASADVIFACAGGSGNGVHTAAAELGKAVIGVDSDQSLAYDENDPIHDVFVTSVVKEVGNVVYDCIEKLLAGTLAGNTYEIVGVQQNAAGIVRNDLYTSSVSEEGQAAIDQAQGDIQSGTITVENTFGKTAEEIQATLDELLAS